DPNGLTDVTQTVKVNAAGASKLVITTSAQTITAGQMTGLVTVQRQDQFSNPTTLGGAQTVYLTSDSAGGQFRQTDGTTVLSGTPPTVTIAASTRSVSFTYRDTLARSSTLSPYETLFRSDPNGLTDVTQTV